jgi:hypothetical protein
MHPSQPWFTAFVMLTVVNQLQRQSGRFFADGFEHVRRQQIRDHNETVQFDRLNLLGPSQACPVGFTQSRGCQTFFCVSE